MFINLSNHPVSDWGEPGKEECLDEGAKKEQTETEATLLEDGFINFTEDFWESIGIPLKHN